jgi:chemotaxis protein methyltransferase CheR
MHAGPALALLAERIAAELGLDFASTRMDELRRGVAAAAQDFGMPDEDACVQWLLATPWTQAQVRTLAGHLTIGETYFFRDAPLLQAFSGHILPELLQRRRAEGRRTLRVWSAGCCSGEEPYSLAILIREALPDLAEWDVSILATDVNPRFLDKARQGRYSEWSFRGAPAGLKQRHFQRAADKRWEVNAAIRGMVGFEQLNLAQDIYPSAINGTDAVDVIFCRNLLMYFGAPQARDAAGRLERCLIHGGWMIVSPTEACAIPFPTLEPVNFESAVVFRKHGGRTGTAVAVQALVPEAPITVPVAVPPAAPVPAESPALARQRACELADQGRLDEALTWCDRWIAADKLDPWGHYVRGAVMAEQGDAPGARNALRRSLYLQPNFVLAHLALGQLARGLGQAEETRRHFAAATGLLRALRPGDALPDAGGLTAGRLREAFAALEERP